MKHPFLIGESIYLRGLEEQDLAGNYFQWFNDQDVCQYNSHGRYPNNLDKMMAYLKKTHSDPSLVVFAIILKENKEHVGNISLQGINFIDRNAEYAIVLGEQKCWGKGVAKAASDMIIKHGFLTLNLHRIHCGTSVKNLGMQKLASYLGMKEEGRRRDALYKHGEYVDLIEYGILRHEYLTKS
jgi:RimJ/RimL family protein N-acetyltransferase